MLVDLVLSLLATGWAVSSALLLAGEIAGATFSTLLSAVAFLDCSLSDTGFLLVEPVSEGLALATPVVSAAEFSALVLVEAEFVLTLFAAELFSATLPIDTLLAAGAGGLAVELLASVVLL